MGIDFSSHQCFAGDVQQEEIRRNIIVHLKRMFEAAGFRETNSESESHRSFAIGPAQRWIHIGDTAGTTETADPDAFCHVSTELSHLVPVADIQMSDSAAVHLLLYKDGKLVDKFGNADFPFFKFKTPSEAADWFGMPQKWGDYLVLGASMQELRDAWVQDWNADGILAESSRLLGWHPDLVFVGYTQDDEGIPLKYDEYLAYIQADVDLKQMTELHFVRPEKDV